MINFHLIIESAIIIEQEGIAALEIESERYLSLGYKSRAHLGEPISDKQTEIEWLIGQLIDIKEQKAYGAINSWCNYVFSRATPASLK